MSIAVSVYLRVVSIASASAMLRADTYHRAPATRSVTFQTRSASLSSPAYIEKRIVAERQDGFVFVFVGCSVWLYAWMGG
jgi:hypothetical protein